MAESSARSGEKEAYQAANQTSTPWRSSSQSVAFENFLKEFPDGSYAPNAHYWLGEIYMKQHQYPKAIEEFNLVVYKFPESGKIADAKLKLGYAFYELGQWQKAAQQFRQIKADYPDTAVLSWRAPDFSSSSREGSVKK